MKVRYDTDTDSLTIVLKETAVAENEETTPGAVLDFDAGGDLTSLEILDASRRVTNPSRVEFDERTTPVHSPGSRRLSPEALRE
jgi:uncharacterized protein YuzE